VLSSGDLRKAGEPLPASKLSPPARLRRTVCAQEALPAVQINIAQKQVNQLNTGNVMETNSPKPGEVVAQQTGTAVASQTIAVSVLEKVRADPGEIASVWTRLFLQERNRPSL
jgi:hypothetical protein